ncbi:MAG TPA: glycerophosphodiester phosphodiesterase family protein, partial [Candidatus Didemnitutus sp.]|nr:glycerophosphodiester phosphodiesterase family protein [Candidatus Didemnitutus sp.]
PASQVSQLAACHANGLSVNQRAIRSARYLHHFHSRGYAVWTWTVNEPARMRTLAGWGIDGILSDNPALLKRVV